MHKVPDENKLLKGAQKTEGNTQENHYHFYNENRAILIKDLENIDPSVPTLSEINLVDLLLYGNVTYNSLPVLRIFCMLH